MPRRLKPRTRVYVPFKRRSSAPRRRLTLLGYQQERRIAALFSEPAERSDEEIAAELDKLEASRAESAEFLRAVCGGDD